jgi:hypothetical protein
MESVRVVDEAHFDDLAQLAMERDTAIRERDESRPAEMALEADGWRDLDPDELPQIDDQYQNSDGQWCLVNEQSLSVSYLPHRYQYRRRVSAPAASGGGVWWLKEEEREAVEYFSRFCDEQAVPEQWSVMSARFRKLLARSTPPGVVLRSERHSIIYADQNANRVFKAKDVIEALAAIGVAVKEVGYE